CSRDARNNRHHTSDRRDRLRRVVSDRDTERATEGRQVPDQSPIDAESKFKMKPFLVISAGELMNARHTKRLKREKHQVISRIEELRRESIESQKQFERFNQSIELVLLEMRRLETAIPSSNPTQRSALVMSLGEHVLRL